MNTEPEQEVQAAPVVKVARDLRQIIELHDALLTQAVHKAMDHLMPGGLAMVSLGAVSSMRDWERRLELVEHAWVTAQPAAVVSGWAVRPDDKTRPAMGDDEDPEWEPPLQTLLFWSEAWRAETGSEYDTWLPTVKSEALFLTWALDWAWRNELHWDDFATDMAKTRSRLESVLFAGTKAERSRVVCDRCEAASMLLKVYGDDGSGLLDRWKCPGCKHKFDKAEFLDAHARQLRHESAAKFVSQRDAIGTLIFQGRSDRTIRKWLAPPVKHTEDRCTNRRCKTPGGKRRAWSPGEHHECPACGATLKEIRRGDPEAVVVGYCDLATHKVWVWWPDLWRLHLITKLRRKDVA